MIYTHNKRHSQHDPLRERNEFALPLIHTLCFFPHSPEVAGFSRVATQLNNHFAVRVWPLVLSRSTSSPMLHPQSDPGSAGPWLGTCLALANTVCLSCSVSPRLAARGLGTSSAAWQYRGGCTQITAFTWETRDTLLPSPSPTKPPPPSPQPPSLPPPTPHEAGDNKYC